MISAVRFIFYLLLLMPTVSVAQFVSTAPIQNAVITGTEYGNNSNTGPWYIAWDDTKLYIGLTAAQDYEPAIMYFDFNPNSDSLGGVASGTNGSTTGKSDWGVTPELPFSAKARLYFLTNSNGSKYAEVTLNTGSGWTVPVYIGTQLNGSTSVTSKNFELFITWAQLGVEARPKTFNWLGTESSQQGYIYYQYPASNYYGNSNTTPTYFYYQHVPNTDSPGDDALSNDYVSFCDHNSSFNYVSGLPTTVYDFTLGKTNNSFGDVNVQVPVNVKRNLVINNDSAGDIVVNFYTDKAAYDPGGIVLFTADKTLPANTKVRYRYLDSVVAEENISGTEWQWTAPVNDFKGYTAEVYHIDNGIEKTYGSIAVDVSSDWSKFPRYGFLSKFGLLDNSYKDSVIKNLNRHHINGLQFYDWADKHHQPLAGTVANPATAWKDIANRDTYKSTVDYYINAAHAHNMKAMSYNLCYGALSDAAADGVQDAWYMYSNSSHQTKAVFTLGAPFKSSIYLTDPGNAAWQQYLAAKNQDVYSVYDFDGYHVDQLGNYGTTYNYNGSTVNVPSGFASFLNAMKTAAPSKKLVMNAVNQYGQQGNIATSPVDFLYTEVWPQNDNYNDIFTIIQNNNTWSSNTKKTVLAAYMNYNVASNPGYFNTPGVLLADAVIFALGGAHIELGEQMLCKEYFPNSNLQMKPDLQKALVRYYDFLTAYQNLLRDGGSLNDPFIRSTDTKYIVRNWPTQNGTITLKGRDLGTKQVIHFINFVNSGDDWRDTDGTKGMPGTYLNVPLTWTLLSKTVKKIWYASPDINNGLPQQLAFTQTGTSVKFTLPVLQYWDMVVAEFE